MTFSIVLPTYNRSVAIRRSIDSVLAQTEADWELLVVSDASTDDTDDVVESYADPRVRLIRLAERAGHPGRPRNVGLAHARGDVVAYLDHDDRYEPEHLATLRRLFERGARLAAVGCRRVSPAGEALEQTSPLDLVWHPEIQVATPLFEPSRVAHLRTVVDEWTESAVGLEDWELWVRLVDRGERFTTTAARTVAIELSPESRRSQIETPHAFVVGVVPTLAQAQSVFRFLHARDTLARLRRLHVDAHTAWYAELGDLVLPDGLQRDDLPSLLEQEAPDDPILALEAKPSAEGVEIRRTLACSTADHARRVEQIMRARFGAKLRFLERTLQAAA